MTTSTRLSIRLVRRLASFDRETLAAAKAQVNRFGTPTATELQSSNDLFFPLLALPGAQARRAKVRNIGYGVPSDFELNFGRYLPSIRAGRSALTRLSSAGFKQFQVLVSRAGSGQER